MQKIKDIFVGPQIRKLIKYVEFDDMFNQVELRAWKAIKTDVTSFPANVRAHNCKEIVNELQKNWIN